MTRSALAVVAICMYILLTMSQSCYMHNYTCTYTYVHLADIVCLLNLDATYVLPSDIRQSYAHPLDFIIRVVSLVGRAKPEG